jgi:tyrosine-protein kinase Etk/Wzc
MPPIDDGNPEMLLTVTGPGTYSISGDGFSLDGKVGVLLSSKYATLMVENIDAEVGTQFNIKYLTNLEAIQNLQKYFPFLIKVKILEY